MTTTYGTLPTSTPNLEYISRAKERLKSGLGMRRPWNQMFNSHGINLPSNFSDAIGRMRTNLSYFLTNYVILALLVLFLSLLWQPVSLIVFVLMMAAWLFLYFLRDEQLVVFNRVIGEKTVLICLSVITIFLLFFTDATANIVWSVLIGAVVVGVHAALRKTDDLFLDEETAEAGGFILSSS